MQQHSQIENFTSEWLREYCSSGKSIHCRKGCSGCCNLAVHATYPEAVVVATEITASQADQLNCYINRLRDVLQELHGLKDYLKKHRAELGPCPFLNSQGACSIYELRPISCRALLSTRPAAWCTVDFAELNDWDKIAFESSLDKQIVAWPTHYVAATQELGQQLEASLLESMQKVQGWSLSGNFAVMVWLARLCHNNNDNLASLREILAANKLDSGLLLTFTGIDLES